MERQAWVDVLTSLTALDALEARCRRSLPDLLADLALVLRRAPRPLPHDLVWSHPSGARLDHLALALLETALDAYLDALVADPGRLFAVLYNALYWRDAPEGDAHYATSGAPRDDRQIWRWMESWRREFEARPHARWLRRIRPPRPTPTALLGWRTAGGAPMLSPDGALLLVTHADALELLDAHTGRSLGPLPRPQGYLGRDHRAHGGFSPKSDRVLTFRDNGATLWSVAPLAPLLTFGPEASALSCAAFSRDGRMVFTGTHGVVRAWDAEDGSPIAVLEAPTGLRELHPCGDDRVLVVDNAWRLWSPRDGELVAPPRPDKKTGALWSVATSRAGDRLIVRSHHALEGFALPAGKRLFRHRLSSQSELDVHPGGELFALRANSQTYELRDAQTGDHRASLPTEHVQRATFDPSGRFLLLRQPRRSALWDLHANAVVAWAWLGVGPGEMSASFSGDGSRLAVGNVDTTLVLDLATLAPVPALSDDAMSPVAFAGAWISPGGSSLWAQTYGGLALWDVVSGRLVRVVPTKHHALRHGRHVLCYRDGELVAVDPETGVDRFVLCVPGDRLEYPKANESDTLLARTRSGLVVGFSLEDGAERYRLPSSSVLALLTPDLFVVRNSDETLGLHAVSTGRELLVLPARSGSEFLLSPDRRWLAVHGFDGYAVEVWELARGGKRHVLSAAYGRPSISFSADSARVTVYSSGPTPQSGNSDPDESLDEAALEPGERFLPAADIPAPRLPPRRLKDVAPELAWDRGARSLADALTFPLASGLLVVDVTADQVELYRMEPPSPR